MRRQVGQELLAKGHLRQSHFQRRHFGREFPAYSCQAGQGLRRLHASVRVRCRRQRSARHWQNPLHLLEVAGPYLDKTPASNSSQTQCCNIVKQKAFALFNKQAQDPDSLTREETEAAALLKHLHYITERIPLSKMLLNDTGNKLLDAAKLKKKLMRRRFPAQSSQRKASSR